MPAPIPPQQAQASAAPPAPAAAAPAAPKPAPQAAAPKPPTPAAPAAPATPAAPAAKPTQQAAAPAASAVAVTLTPKKKIGFVQGPNVCKSCHETENKVWAASVHFKAFADAHKSPKAPAILDAAGGEKNMRKNKTCVLCHYTLVQDDEADEGVAKAGPSCESCHGASSKWLEVHNKKDAPKEQRVKDAAAQGMIWSHMHLDIAQNCMSCHGLAHPDLDPNVMGKMLEAGHPVSPDFELAKYSQGSVRHRFYAPDTDKNKEMAPAELARLFVTGQAAKLISANWAATRSSVAKYKEIQTQRADLARKALGAGQSVPEVAEFLKAPSEAGAHNLVEAIKAKDLSAQFGAQLPKDFK